MVSVYLSFDPYIDPYIPLYLKVMIYYRIEGAKDMAL